MTSKAARYEWYQTTSHVIISIFVKNVSPTNVDITFSPSSLSLCIKTISDFTLELDLAHDIIPSDSNYSIKSTQVSVSLKKQLDGIKWGDLEGDDRAELFNQVNSSVSGYPSSSRNKKDWDKIEKGIVDDGDKPLDDLFKTIYKDASDETRRAMIKSYTESNGTCLSTNWEDVGKKRVEVTPPDGMVAKKFEI